MQVGSKYNLALLSSCNGKLRLTAATLVTISDSTNAAASTTITEHNLTRYKLPATLKAVDIYSQLFYHFREEGSSTLIVVPEAYINQTTVVEVSLLTKTVVFSLSSLENYALLVRVLDDNGFQYRAI